MNKTVDARGLSCPLPVMLAQNAIKSGLLPVDILVDSVTSRENVRRMAEKQGYVVQISQNGDEFRLTIRKSE